MWLGLWLAFPAAALELRADTPLPPLGGTLVLELTGGAPGAGFAVAFARAPASIPLAGGTLHLDRPRVLVRGTLDGAGAASVPVSLPNKASLDGALAYFQAALTDGPLALSNAVSVRLGDRPDTRRSDAVALSADGTRAWVAHAHDGTLSVLDAVGHTVIGELAIGPLPVAGSLPLKVAVDPLGRHVFVVHPQQRVMAVIDAATDSVAALVPVAGASRDVAFSADFADDGLLYVTTERGDLLQVFRAGPDAAFTSEAPIPLAGRGAGPLATLADGRLVVGHRGSHELEIVDPATGATDARIPLGALPYGLVVEGARARVASFDITGPRNGTNVILDVHLPSGSITAQHLVDAGTDYVDLASNGTHTVVVGAGSGSLVVADGSLVLEDIVDLAPGDPLATPTDADLGVDQAVVINSFRETAAFVDLSGGPPYAVTAEVPLAWSGSPRRALIDLSPEDDGEWFFRSVQLFSGTPDLPNPVTCATCHPYGGSDNLVRGSGRQPLPMHRCGDTPPWGSGGAGTDLLDVVASAAMGHNWLGVPGFPGGPELIVTWLENSNPAPASPWREDDGALSEAAERGRALFAGEAGCITCHAPPLFIPTDPGERTVAGGVGTGLAPANVPTLLGVWASGPWLHDGSARTLLQVLTRNVDDAHGTTSGLSQQELVDLATYVSSL